MNNSLHRYYRVTLKMSMQDAYFWMCHYVWDTIECVSMCHFCECVTISTQDAYFVNINFKDYPSNFLYKYKAVTFLIMPREIFEMLSQELL